jgi:ribose transport system ATP-binding protein
MTTSPGGIAAPAQDGTAPVLRVEGVCKAFGATQALDDVSFDLRRGTIHALLGGNGSGKSTLIKMLAGVQPGDSGRVVVGEDAWEATEVTPEASRAAGLRFVHQQNSTFAGLTVAENLHVGRGFETARGGRIRWSRVRRRTEGLLERFQIDARPDQRMSELGRARQAMVAIARALQDQEDAHSGVLVLDEPTSSLPATEVTVLFEALRRYAADGQSILFVTHRLDEVMDIADRATMLRDGRVAGTVERGGMTEDGLVELMVGRALARDTGQTHALSTSDVVLSCDGLSGGALRSVGFSLRRGEILGIAGLLGSGRSTLLRVLFGLIRPDGGEVSLDGRRYAPNSIQDAMREGVAYVPEDRVQEAAFLELPVTDNISMTVLGDYYRKGLFRHRAERADARREMAAFQVKASSERARFGSLSGGNQQKVVLARWLRRAPRLLLLDEPTNGVDVGARAELYGLVRAAAGRGTSVIVVSSEFEELERLCDRVLVFQRGRITAEVKGADIDTDRLEQLVQGRTNSEPA